MSPSQRSPTGVDTSSPLRRKRENAIPRKVRLDGDTSDSSMGQFHYFGAYGRIVAKLRRIAAVLEADDALSLPRVSVNDLERAASTFLDEVRLGLPQREGSSSTPGSSTTRGRYGPKVEQEIRDPDRAARVRANRAQVKEEQLQRFQSRRPSK